MEIIGFLINMKGEAEMQLIRQITKVKDLDYLLNNFSRNSKFLKIT
jgi:hypothetical protein